MLKSDAQECIACDGTGKQVDGDKGIICPACNGRGHHFTLAGGMRPVRVIGRQDPNRQLDE